ncbi:MAG: DUF5711 family protein [Oscillospiraceae bacterium]|jgi:hypothetical protein|nr:DUF5711 family protein [Oscillospiraceae bacterium]
MKKRLIFTLIILLIAAVAVLGTLFLGGELSLRGARRAVNAIAGNSIDAVYAFEPGLNEVFADIDGTVVAAGGSGFVAYDKNGAELARAGFSMKTPAIAAKGDTAAVFDLGGHAVRIVYADGTVAELPVANEIISVSVGLGGGFAVCTSGDGEYKGKAAFYKMRSGTPALIYEWFSGEGYILGAAVSKDGKRFAVNTLNSNGGRVILLDSGSTAVSAEFLYSLGVILEITFDKSGTLIARTADGVLFITGDGTTVSSATFNFAAGEPNGYSAGDGFIAAHFAGTQSSAGELVTADIKGRELGRIQTSRRLVSLTASGNRIAALWSDGLDIFDRNLRLIASYPDASGSNFAVPRGGEAAVVMNGRAGHAFAKQNNIEG